MARALTPALCAVVISFLPACARKPQSRFATLPGFSIEVAAPPEQTGSLVALTFDSLGRPVVAKERGGPTILIDGNGDGVFETEKVFSDKVVRLQGMWFDGRTLYAIGDDAAEKKAGLYKLEDRNGDDVADTCERLNLFTGPMGEHGPHAIRRGPDGIPTVMLGNHTGVPAEIADEQSPLRDTRENQLLTRYNDARGHAANIMAPGGILTRLSQESGKYSIVDGGFRNAYDHAFNLEGEAFTFDSDMEWDINLPWYRGVRTLHLIPGGDYGWRTGSGKLPNYMLDTLPPVRELGRGSPVGVEFYQHWVYPREFRDALLEGDWSRGRILVTNLARDGATYSPSERGGREFVHGEPLNVTDLEVGPDGFVYFTLGGRDTDGGLFRIRYAQSWLDKSFSKDPRGSGIVAVVRQPQPLSSWGHAALLQAKERMGDSWGTSLEQLARDTGAASADRVQALLILQRLGPAPKADLLQLLSKDTDAGVRAAAVYVTGLHSSDRAKAIAVTAVKDTDPFVRRRAAEALVRMDAAGSAPVEDLLALVTSRHRFERWAGRAALERVPRDQWQEKALAETNPNGVFDLMYALTRTAKSDADLIPLFEKQIELVEKTPGSRERIRLLRAFQLTAMAHKGGAPEPIRRRMSAAIVEKFPRGDESMNRETARTLAYCGQPEAIGRILAAMPKEDDNQPLQIFYAYCLRDMKKGWTKEQRTQLTNWFAKASEWRGGASFTGYINLMFDSALVNSGYTGEEKKYAYAKIPVFAPLAEKPEPNSRGFVATAAVHRKRGVSSYSAQEIYEFQMFDPMTLKADPAKGEKIFEKECATCHRHGSSGKDFGPDLTTVTSRFKKKDVLEAILWPSRTISDQYQSYIIETKDGDILNGLLVSEDGAKLVVKTAEVERPIEIPKGKLKDRRISNVSIMPEDVLSEYPMGDVSDLMAFIMGKSQKK